MSQERIFAIKLSELEHQYEQTLGCLKSYQTEDRQKSSRIWNKSLRNIVTQNVGC